MALQIGDKLPNFSAIDSLGNDFDSQSVIGKKPVVIYFYPKDNTPACTAQACSFRDQYQDFTDLGAEVIGISSDSESSHQTFTNKFKLPFILLSDANSKIRKAFGVPTALFGLLPGRVTYVADNKGTIVMIFDSMIGTKHISRALAAIKKLV